MQHAVCVQSDVYVEYVVFAWQFCSSMRVSVMVYVTCGVGFVYVCPVKLGVIVSVCVHTKYCNINSKEKMWCCMIPSAM